MNVKANGKRMLAAALVERLGEVDREGQIELIAAAFVQVETIATSSVVSLANELEKTGTFYESLAEDITKLTGAKAVPLLPFITALVALEKAARGIATPLADSEVMTMRSERLAALTVLRAAIADVDLARHAPEGGSDAEAH